MNQSDLQIDASGKLKHFLTIEGLSVDTLEALLADAQDIYDKRQHIKPTSTPCQGQTIANLFFETSTRTRTSFELAAKRLGATVLNLMPSDLSIKKGESLADTLRTLEAMGCNGYVVRHSDNYALENLAEIAAPTTHLINAGAGTRAHPTQALLDVMTIRQSKPNLAEQKIVIVGDVLHSRVANSLITLLQKLGVGELHLVGPDHLLPEVRHQSGIHYSNNLVKSLPEADIIITLRIQFERMKSATMPNKTDYFKQYGLTKHKLEIANPNAIVMHPGPMNRNVEIADDVADGPQSVILQQIQNGVAMRMAILKKLLT